MHNPCAACRWGNASLVRKSQQGHLTTNQRKGNVPQELAKTEWMVEKGENGQFFPPTRFLAALIHKRSSPHSISQRRAQGEENELGHE